MIVALAGRRVDAADATPSRFPLANVELVRSRLRDVMVAHGAQALVSSAAAGADLIAQDVAHELGLDRVIVLPYPIALFRERSVTDRPGHWGALFDELVADAAGARAKLVLLGAREEAAASTDAYRAATDAILDYAEHLAARDISGAKVLAIAVWDGASRGPDDMTDQFRRAAARRRAEVIEVSTLA